jgi:methyltransferase
LTKELRTQLIGQIARAATIYHVDEIVVFDDKLAKQIIQQQRENRRHYARSHRDHHDTEEVDMEQSTEDDKRGRSDPHEFMARIFQFCECPQYLRKQFFPMHPDLQCTGLLSPLDAPHHVRAYDRCPFREGIVLDQRGPSGHSLVDCGLPGRRLVEIDLVLSPSGLRCTVQLDPATAYTPGPGPVSGTVVSPAAPRETLGTAWGYTTRLASSLSAVWDECPYEGGYDLKIGTSERGRTSLDYVKFRLPVYRHALIVFGGVAGIEECVDADESMKLPVMSCLINGTSSLQYT